MHVTKAEKLRINKFNTKLEQLKLRKRDQMNVKMSHAYLKDLGEAMLVRREEAKAGVEIVLRQKRIRNLASSEMSITIYSSHADLALE